MSIRMQGKNVIDLTDEPRNFNTHSDFLEAVFKTRPTDTNLENVDKQKTTQHIDAMLKKTSGGSDIELDLTSAIGGHLSWKGMNITQPDAKLALQPNPKPLPQPNPKTAPSQLKPYPVFTNSISKPATDKPIGSLKAPNIVKDRSYLKSSIEIHHVAKAKFNDKTYMEEGWSDLMKLKSILPKKNTDEEVLPKKRERQSDEVAKQTLSNFIRQKQLENKIAEKRKKHKPADISRVDIEKQLAISRAINGPAYMQEEAKKMRFLSRTDLTDLNEYLLNLTAEQLEKPQTDLQKIPETFNDGAAYISSLQPAFFEELRADLFSSLAQAMYGKASLVRLVVACTKENLSFLNVAEDVDKKRPLFQAAFRSDDFVLIIPKTTKAITDWRGTSDYFFAVCDHLYDGERRVSPQIYLKVSSSKLPYVNSASDYYVVWVESLITILREFKMIRLAEFMEMTPFIFTPSCRRIPHKLSIPPNFFQFLQANFNDSQVRAIEEACNIHSGVTLIQGPPGTGKTHTILGIISAFLLSTGYAANRPRVLVCAPSNAAIDELARRVVIEGLYNEYGDKRTDIRCIRLGSWTKEQLILRARKAPTKQDPPEEVQSIALNTLVAERLKMHDINDPSIEIDKLRKEVTQIEIEMDKARKSHLQAKYESLIAKRRLLENKIYREKLAKNSHEDNRKNTIQELLTGADIIFTTLSGAFSKDMDLTGGGWNFVIVDEACQALELATLIPMQYDAKITVLIGDPKQLPGTTFSFHSSKSGYDRSLFERMMTAGCPVTMLEVQYRMAPIIRSFPSLFFYQNKLRDALEVINREQPYWLPEVPFVFIDLLSSRESREASETSMRNISEAEYIANLFVHFKPFHSTNLDIGVITPYKSQVAAIRRALDAKCGTNYKKDIEVNTVDGFQGREKAVIIFSCVRTGDNIGFLSDQRRLNVAITRAKYGLWVVGHSDCLRRQPVWRDFVNFAIEDNVIIKARNETDINPIFVLKPPIVQPPPARIPVTQPRPEVTAGVRRFAKPVVPEPPKPVEQAEAPVKAIEKEEARPAKLDYLSSLLQRMKEERKRP